MYSAILLIQDRPLMVQAHEALSWVLSGLWERLEGREIEASASAPKFLMKTSVFIHWVNILVEMDGNRGDATGMSQFSLLQTRLLRGAGGGRGKVGEGDACANTRHSTHIPGPGLPEDSLSLIV